MLHLGIDVQKFEINSFKWSGINFGDNYPQFFDIGEQFFLLF